MALFTWILTPELTDIDIDKINEYSCYDDKCLISTFYKDELLDFLEDNGVKVDEYTLTSDFQYKFKFNMSRELFDTKINDFIGFKTGRFKTTSIYTKPTNDTDTWKKIWKKGAFY